MKITGKIWKYGDNVNTDMIYPGRFTYTLLSEEEMAKHALEDLDSDFYTSSINGDILVGGENWGCGSSREQAVKAIKARGVSAVICKSAARIYFRNAMNEGFPVITCPEACDYIISNVPKGGVISFDLDTCTIMIQDKIFKFQPFPEYVQKMLSSGGLLEFTKQQIKQRG